MKTIDMQFKELTKELLMLHTNKMRNPCVFINMNVNQRLEYCSVDEILSLQQTKFLSSNHNGSYWADKPLYAEVQGRKKTLDLERMFLKESGDYYVTYFVQSTLHPAGWKTIRACGNNDFDDYLASRTTFKDYMKESVFHNHWISNGNTLSSLHADPVDTFFLQVQGTKRFRLIEESLLLSKYVDLRQPHKLKMNFDRLKTLGIKSEEFTVSPGMAVFMPSWCFHEIESQESGLNVSLTSHYPRSRSVLRFSPLQAINKARRFWYPKLVQKKRIQFQIENISVNAVPFFPWFSSFVSNNTFLNDTTYQPEYYILNRKTRRIIPVLNMELVSVLKQIDGFVTVQDISNLTGLGQDTVIDSLTRLIEDEFIQILFDSEDKYNYFYQSIEPKTLSF